MGRATLGAVAVVVAGVAAGAAWALHGVPRSALGAGPALVPAPAPAPALALRELLRPGPRLIVSDRARALHGARVRLVGYMADLELPPRGALYLVPRPVRGDEAGGGTADLPPDSVLVVVASAAGQTIPHIPGLLEATGIFEVGNRSDDEGRVSSFRLRLDTAPVPASPKGDPR